MGLDDYKRQQDLLFQQTDEKAKLALQAKETRIANALKNKKLLIRGIARIARTSPEKAQKLLEKQVRELEDSSN
jgi:hypothetical protein